MADEPERKDRTKEFKAQLEKQRARSISMLTQRIRGLAPRECPYCGYYGKFGPVGFPPRLDALCPSCGSRERHRLLRLWFDKTGAIKENDEILHFAPERTVRAYLAGRCKRYVTADLMAPRVDLQLNIEAIDLEDACFTKVICNHVLEHVDDAKALREIYRILKPGGLAILSTPICEGWDKTYENPEVTRGPQSVLHFGQWDHVRFFGRDFRDRVKAAGFMLKEFTAEEPDVLRFGLMRGEKVFLATKPNS